MANKTPIKNPPQPWELDKSIPPEVRERIARANRPLLDSVMSRPGSRKPLPPTAKREREKRYSFGALEKDKNLTLEQYRAKAGHEPMGYKERKTKEVFAALDAASAASVPKLMALGGKTIAGFAGARVAAGQGAKELLKQTAKETGKQFTKKGTKKVAEGEIKDSMRQGEQPQQLIAAGFPSGRKKQPDVVSRPGLTDTLVGRSKGTPKPRVNRTAQAIADKKRMAQGDAETKVAMTDFSAAVKRRDAGRQLVKRPSNYTTTGGKISPLAGGYESVRKPSA
tara:strand:+ start:26 stop:868 length:843 start_codon:yes stop_codon:yes gene_type:complete